MPEEILSFAITNNVIIYTNIIYIVMQEMIHHADGLIIHCQSYDTLSHYSMSCAYENYNSYQTYPFRVNQLYKQKYVVYIWSLCGEFNIKPFVRII